jgi:polyisoprenoid-binding protein YceI
MLGDEPRHILIATDGSPQATAALRFARIMADRGEWLPDVLAVCVLTTLAERRPVSRFLTLAAFLALAATEPAGAQPAFNVRPQSRVILLGRSNVHSWSCATSTFDAAIAVDSSARHSATPGRAGPTIRLTVSVPVTSLNCGRKRMNEDMYRALKAGEFPDIHYYLESYIVDSAGSTSDSVTIHTVGQLTVAGKTRSVEFLVRAERGGGDGLKGKAVGHLLMTDFGIKPPTAFLGAIRTKNALEVRVEIWVSRGASAVANLAVPDLAAEVRGPRHLSTDHEHDRQGAAHRPPR